MFDFQSQCCELAESQKYLGIVLDSRLVFKEYLEIFFKKVTKIIGLLRKL